MQPPSSRRCAGGPGAILIFDDEQTSVDKALGSLPLVRKTLIDTEVIELNSFPALEIAGHPPTAASSTPPLGKTRAIDAKEQK